MSLLRILDLVTPWESPLIVLATSAGSVPTDFARAWQHAGDALYSADAARKVAISSPLSFHPSTPRKRFSFPHDRRVTRAADIERVRHEGKALRTAALLVRFSPSPHDFLRVGIVVPRHGHSAVDRNRVKRRLRELVRMHVLCLPQSLDLVMWAQPRAYQASFAELRRDIEVVISRLARRAVIST